jgi:hypothetical protein
MDTLAPGYYKSEDPSVGYVLLRVECHDLVTNEPRVVFSTVSAEGSSCLVTPRADWDRDFLPVGPEDYREVVYWPVECHECGWDLDMLMFATRELADAYAKPCPCCDGTRWDTGHRPTRRACILPEADHLEARIIKE